MMGLDLEPSEPSVAKPKDTLWEDVFAFIHSINVSKKSLILTEEDERRYAKCRFFVVKMLAYHADVLPFVNAINAASGMEPRMEYEFLLNAVPTKTRTGGKWLKKTPSSLYLKSVQNYYGYNERKAEEAMKLMSVEQLAMIDNKNKREDSWTSSGDTGSKSG
jgi:hypothetical protein